jgi:hypothetical protein
MNAATTPAEKAAFLGGDACLFGPHLGHPSDPRTADESDTASGLRYMISEAEAMLGRAERALDRGDINAAIDIMKSAGADLAGACWA